MKFNNIPAYIIDDDESVRWVLTEILKDRTDTVRSFGSAEDCLANQKSLKRGVYLLDIDLPDMDGITLMKKLQVLRPNLGSVFIILTGYGSYSNTMESMKAGAFECHLKPFDLTELETTLSKAFKELNKVTHGETQICSAMDQRIIGSGRKMNELFKCVAQVSGTGINVLIIGRTGTGKELIAQEIHRNSERVEKPFVAINCAAIPHELLESELFGHLKGAYTGASENREGKIKQAAGGTLFLDEIGDMPLALQSKMLRVLQEQEFQPLGSERTIKADFRLIAATNKDLEDEISKGTFREDLFYRLNVFCIKTPDLNERKEDIPELCDFFFKKFNRELNLPIKKFSESSKQCLRQHNWPGNVRELQNLIKTLSITCTSKVIELHDLPQFLVTENIPESCGIADLEYLISTELSNCNGDGYNRVLNKVEPILLKISMELTRNNQSQAAQLLGLNRNTLRKKIQQHSSSNTKGIEPVI